MLTGQRFKLRQSALAIEVVNGMRLRVTIPTRTILKVIAGPIDGDQMVDVLWEDKRVSMFAVDLITRGTEIPARKARARIPIMRHIRRQVAAFEGLLTTRPLDNFSVADHTLGSILCTLTIPYRGIYSRGL